MNAQNFCSEIVYTLIFCSDLLDEPPEHDFFGQLHAHAEPDNFWGLQQAAADPPKRAPGVLEPAAAQQPPKGLRHAGDDRLHAPGMLLSLTLNRNSICYFANGRYDDGGLTQKKDLQIWTGVHKSLRFEKLLSERVIFS